MGLDGGRSLVLTSYRLGLSQLLDQRKLLAVQATGELPASTARKQRHKLLMAQVQEVIELNASVGKLLKNTFLLSFGSVSGHGEQWTGLKDTNVKKISRAPFPFPAEKRRTMAEDFDPLVPQRVENAIKKRLQELSLIDCEEDVAAFANCVRNRFVLHFTRFTIEQFQWPGLAEVNSKK